MGREQAILARDEAESLIGWWRDAGVDTLIDEEPRRWLDAGTQQQPVRSELVEEPSFLSGAVREEVQAFDKLRPNGLILERSTPLEVDPFPATLPELLDWFAAGDVPEAGPPARRVRASGEAACGLMILTDLPELCDLDAGHLLSGPIAELFDKMLTALGRTRETIYLASLCPGRPPSGRLGEAHFERLAAAARAHIRLAAPKQLWLMGDAASRALLGMSDGAASGKLHSINLEGVMIDAIATAHPRLLLRHPERKKRAWADMQRLIAGPGQ